MMCEASDVKMCHSGRAGQLASDSNLPAMSDPSRLRELLRVKKGSRLKLADHDPDATLGWQKTTAVRDTAKLDVQLADLQDRLWAEAKHGVLIVLQGIDASGKDGTVKHVM